MSGWEKVVVGGGNVTEKAGYKVSAEGDPQSFSIPASSYHRALEKTQELEAPDISLRVQVR